MRHFRTLTQAVRSFGHRRDGSLGVVMGVAVSVLALTMGFGLNTAQLYLVQSNLRNALDTAVTSTARDITTGAIKIKDAEENVRAFLDANGGTGFVSADDIVLDALIIDKTKKTVEAQASVNVAVAIPLFNTGPYQRVASQSAAVYSDKNIEVAMMLDITGSMGHSNKLQDLQTAAKNAVSTFLGGQDPSNPRVRVSIVPYADAVNVGPSLDHTVFVETGYTTGEPPKLEDPILVGGGGSDDCATERKGSYQFSDVSPYTAMVNRDYRLAYCPGAELIPLSADKSALDNTIDSFTASGYTAGHIGIQWTWYMLSPKWGSVLPVASKPAAYNHSKTAKIAILMTDGQFNTAFAGVGKKGKTRGGQASRSRNYAERLCSEMKRDGIEIYSIGFMLNSGSAKAVMKKCASKDYGSVQHYFEAATGQELDAAFQKIAANIERLALTK